MPVSEPARHLWPTVRALRRAIQPAVDFLLPTGCFACRGRLGPRQWRGACPDCWAGFRPLRPPLCDGCGRPRPEATDLLGPARGRCAPCLLAPPPLDRVRAAVLYDEHARRFLLRAKLGGRRELFADLAAQLARVARRSGIARGCTLAVPVPSHPWTTLRRGFSPARDLAGPLARDAGLQVGPRVLVRRWHSGVAIKRLGAAGRRAAVGDAFRVRGSLRGERILLVDDVMTTGVTLATCAARLRRAGCREVRALVWARTLD